MTGQLAEKKKKKKKEEVNYIIQQKAEIIPVR